MDKKIIIIIIVVVILCSAIGAGIYFFTSSDSSSPAKSPASNAAKSPASNAATPPASNAATPPASKTLPSDISKVFGWSGNHENPGDKNQTAEDCRQKALNSGGKYVAWGHRNAQHPDPNWRDTCFLYTQGFAPFVGNAGDTIHQTGCLRPGEKVEWGCKTQAPTFSLPAKIGLKGGRGDKYCADEDGRVICNRDARLGWEVFTVENLGNNQIALKGGRGGKYCADEDGKVICNRDARLSWETFTLENLGNNQIALKGGRSGKYCADEDGRIICNRDARLSWETFKWDSA